MCSRSSEDVFQKPRERWMCAQHLLWKRMPHASRNGAWSCLPLRGELCPSLFQFSDLLLGRCLELPFSLFNPTAAPDPMAAPVPIVTPVRSCTHSSSCPHSSPSLESIMMGKPVSQEPEATGHVTSHHQSEKESSELVHAC